LAVDFIDAENESNGKELTRTPNRKLNLDIDRQFGKFSVGTSIYLVDNSYDNVANTERLDGYGTVDLRGAYTVTPEWKLQLKASNIFDKDHYSAKSYSLGRYQQPGTEVLFSVVYTPSL
jgi:vitamin B12 transporter